MTLHQYTSPDRNLPAWFDDEKYELVDYEVTKDGEYISGHLVRLNGPPSEDLESLKAEAEKERDEADAAELKLKVASKRSKKKKRKRSRR